MLTSSDILKPTADARRLVQESNALDARGLFWWGRIPVCRHSLGLGLLLVWSFHMSTISSHAASTIIWDGGGADALWSTGNNWDSDAVPGSGDNVQFGSGFGSGTLINLNGNRTTEELIINTLTGFELTNSTLTLGSGVITRNDIAGTEADHTISSAITIGAEATWDINGSGSLIVGDVDNNNNIFTVGGSGNVVISGVLSGSEELFRTGTGTLTLLGANTYDEETTVSGGVLNIQHSTALGTDSIRSNVEIGGELQMQGGISVGTELLHLNGSGVSGGGGLRNISGNNSWAGEISLVTASTIGSDSGTLTLSGVVSGSGALTKTGAGTLTLSGNNSFTGDFSVDDGTLLLGASDRIVNSVDVTLGGGGFNTGGYDETVGTLTLTADSIIDLGASDSVLHFADSSGVSWTASTTLTITNWSGDWSGGGTDQIYFGSSSSGLTSGQQAQIRFYDGGVYHDAAILATGELVPVPEPATIVGVVLLVGLVLFRERKNVLGLVLRVRDKCGN